jgi:hypothetical protein
MAWNFALKFLILINLLKNSTVDEKTKIREKINEFLATPLLMYNQMLEVN